MIWCVSKVRLFTLVWMVSAVACVTGPHPPASPPRRTTMVISIAKMTLANGLRVVLVNDPRATAKLGRGNRANGGGGGNAFNAGGGGGGNGGVGGPGGIECCGMMPGTGGLSGSEMTIPVAERVSFGGGGGQGHSNSDSMPGAGGSGGGLVIVHAGSITGTGSIDAGGRSGTSLDSDGAGGGGAGGTIIVRATVSTFTGTLLARGGAGGDVTDGSTNLDVHGPGGGGGGGHVAVEGVSATTLVYGGASGTDALDPRGAGPGADGYLEP